MKFLLQQARKGIVALAIEISAIRGDLDIQLAMLCDEATAFPIWELMASISRNPAVPVDTDYILAVM